MLKTIFTFLSIFILGKSFALDNYSKSWLSYLETVGVDQGFLERAYYDYEFSSEWRFDSNYRQTIEKHNPIKNSDLEDKICGDTIYPTSPYSWMKSYHLALYKRYQNHRLPYDSYACKAHSRGTRKFCLRSDFPKLVVISDTFMDECGNKFRAFWLVTYNSDNESMGTLLSKGRRIRPREGSPFPDRDFQSDTSYSLSRSNFILFAPLFEGDAEKISEAKRTALRNGFRVQNQIFKWEH